MQKTIVNILVKQVLPLLIGAAGALVATDLPWVHHAFCVVS
ncbi:hypothetical protein [Sinirhodobacter huangdaonensis]|nr:hypothetical protein [Sinirhodobacter huangdaonensis]